MGLHVIYKNIGRMLLHLCNQTSVAAPVQLCYCSAVSAAMSTDHYSYSHSNSGMPHVITHVYSQTTAQA